MNNTGTQLQLEARVNITGANDPCALCGRWAERTLGATEVYLAGTEEPVCQDCAGKLDLDLARFAYDPAFEQPKLAVAAGVETHFGVCPALRSTLARLSRWIVARLPYDFKNEPPAAYDPSATSEDVPF